jgi:hypothetical protein
MVVSGGALDAIAGITLADERLPADGPPPPTATPLAGATDEVPLLLLLLLLLLLIPVAITGAPLAAPANGGIRVDILVELINSTTTT